MSGDTEEFAKLIQDISKAAPKKRKRESQLWRMLSDGIKKTGRNIQATRIESYGVPGIPDVLLASEEGGFSWLELKSTKGHGRVNLSPFQVSWMTRHKHCPQVFILLLAPVVLDNSLTGRTYVSSRLGLHLFPAAAATDLRIEGSASTESMAVFEGPTYDWDLFFAMTCPL